MIPVLEAISVYTPLGIRFWDAVTDSQIRDSLAVDAWPEARPSRSVRAFRTASDVYAFHRLPGLLELENRLQPPGASPPPAPRRFVVRVEDERRRFLPVAFTVDLPLPYPGVFLAGAEASPLAPSPQGFVLLSAPTRPDISWLAVVRGELAEVIDGRPAANALVRLGVPGEPSWYGLADEAGRVALFLPYPTLVEGLGGSPGNGASSPLAERTWEVTVEVFYEPGALAPLPGTGIPDYPSLLGQRQAGVWQESPELGGGESPQWTGELVFGTQLTLATRGLSQLLVSPAESPP